MERTGAVILAAGLSSRMHEFKPLLELGDSTIIVRAIENLKGHLRSSSWRDIKRTS